LVRDGLIAEVGKWRDLSSRYSDAVVKDLGESILLPALVNAHCHLDYTGMAGLISPPAKGAFADWIKSILALKAHWSYTEFAESWMKGARQLVESGCTTVADIEAVPELLPDAPKGTPLRILSFIEMTGVRSGHQPAKVLTDAMHHVRRLDAEIGLSPHALYSTPPDLWKLTAELMESEGLLVSSHLAESRGEFDMYQDASGPLHAWLKPQRPMDDCGGRSPVQQAHRLGMLRPNFIAVHVNYLAQGDAELLGANGSSVVHCPRSHDYFQHDAFPFEELKKAGVNICLGTDSLASSRLEDGKIPTLNLWDEMRLFARKFSNVPAEEILRMATLNGAKALRLSELGDFVAISARSLDEAVFDGPGNVRTFIEGVEV